MSRYISAICVLVGVSLLGTAAAVPSTGQDITGNENGFIFLGSIQRAVAQPTGKSFGILQNMEDKYYLSVNSGQWAAAKKDCQNIFGPEATLANLETEEEKANLTQWLSESSDQTVTTLWTGGRYDGSRQDWVWDNGVQIGSWRKWSRTPVTSSVSRVVLNRDGQFTSSFQTSSVRYICELPAGADIPEPCYSDNDLVIVVDSSGSISKEEYAIALEFTARLAVTWRDNPKNRVSVLVYSNGVQYIFELSHSLSITQVRDQIYNAPHFQGGTGSDYALDTALDQFTRNGRNVPKNLVFLTDGWSNNPLRTAEAAQRVTDAGIRAFSVGIGQGVSPHELLAIAGNNANHVFTVDGFHELLQLLQPVSRTVCQ